MVCVVPAAVTKPKYMLGSRLSLGVSYNNGSSIDASGDSTFLSNTSSQHFLLALTRALTTFSRHSVDVPVLPIISAAKNSDGLVTVNSAQLITLSPCSSFAEYGYLLNQSTTKIGCVFNRYLSSAATFNTRTSTISCRLPPGVTVGPTTISATINSTVISTTDVFSVTPDPFNVQISNGR